METYALFEDESVSRIVFEFFTPSPTDDPVRLACVGIEDTGVVHSAHNGCLSAYHLLARQGYIKPGERFFPSCQFGEAQANLRARGSSAGLAFCLKFSREVIKHTTGKSQTFAVAATGVIDNASRDAAVGRVERLDRKVRAALEVLEKGDLLFIPAANAGEISPELKAALAAKGVALKPVGTVAEALSILVPPAPRSEISPKRHRYRFWLAAAALLGLFAGIWWLQDDHAADLVTLCQQGRYLDAKVSITQQLDQDPADREALYLHRQLTEPLALEVGLSFLAAGSRGMQPQKMKLESGHHAIAVNAGDLYRFSCEVGDSCYLYIAQADAAGAWRFMAVETALTKAGQRYFLPSDTRDWFRIEAGDLGGSVYLVAARRPGLDLEQLWRRYSASAGSERDGYGRELNEHLEYRRQANAGGLAGVYFAELKLAPSASAPLIR